MQADYRLQQMRYLLRVTLQLKDDSIGNIKYDISSERKQRGLIKDNYPNEGNHIAIFECQLKQPNIFCLENHTHKEYLWASKLNFRNWKLVDIDNYMEGNKHFTKLGGKNAHKINQQKLDKFYRKEPHDMDPEEEARYKKAITRGMRQHLKWLDTYETNSNADFALKKMYEQKRREEENAEKIKAEE